MSLQIEKNYLKSRAFAVWTIARVCVLVRLDSWKKERKQFVSHRKEQTKKSAQPIELPHTSKINGKWSFTTTTTITTHHHFPSLQLTALFCIICALCCAHCTAQMHARKFYMARTHCKPIQQIGEHKVYEMKTNTRAIWSNSLYLSLSFSFARVRST